ncbi:hypothetical protein [Hymenobacter pini]|uniref:hypothetical protein n=1 Tax=Hymenobacter pini TaxID=2880879 RepID=UPI001CF4B5AF|nr:hypothetical protein [Hymenobacter pini]MCA8829741.1 hypothetical protein [Hymenobacter pini]
MKFLIPALSVALLAHPGQPNQARTSPSFFTTYTYQSYSILDKGSSSTPMAAKGVGGTLRLNPDGTYQKRLTLAGNGSTLRFDQDGRFTFAADSIRFVYSKNGQPRTDRGTFRLRNGLLTITLAGFPAGNQSIYTLTAVKPGPR